MTSLASLLKISSNKLRKTTQRAKALRHGHHSKRADRRMMMRKNLARASMESLSPYPRAKLHYLLPRPRTRHPALRGRVKRKIPKPRSQHRLQADFGPANVKRQNPSRMMNLHPGQSERHDLMPHQRLVASPGLLVRRVVRANVARRQAVCLTFFSCLIVGALASQR